MTEQERIAHALRILDTLDAWDAIQHHDEDQGWLSRQVARKAHDQAIADYRAARKGDK